MSTNRMENKYYINGILDCSENEIVTYYKHEPR